MTDTVFRFPVRVYIEDVDAGSIVYYANYLKYMERARTEWLRDAGFEQSELKTQGIFFVVRSASVDFHQPAKLDDLLDVTVEVKAIRKASIELRQQIFLAGSDKPLISADIKAACVALDQENITGPVAIPGEIKQALEPVKTEPAN